MACVREQGMREGEGEEGKKARVGSEKERKSGKERLSSGSIRVMSIKPPVKRSNVYISTIYSFRSSVNRSRGPRF